MNKCLKAHRHTKIIQCNNILAKWSFAIVEELWHSLIILGQRRKVRVRAKPLDPKRTKGYFRMQGIHRQIHTSPFFYKGSRVPHRLRLPRPGGGGGALRYRGGLHPCYIFREWWGLFLRPPHVRDFVKEGYFFVPRYEVWGSKSPNNPRNIRGSDAEWLLKWLGFRVCCRPLLPLNTQRIIKSKVKIRVPFIQCQCFDKRRGVYLVEKSQRFY